MPVLDAHLGVAADELPVVVETIAARRWAGTDIALASLTARDPEATLVGGGGGDERRHSSLGGLMANGGGGRFGSGQVGRLNVAAAQTPRGPRSRSVLHLFRHNGVPLAVLQRVGNPQYGSESRLEVLAADPDAPATFLVAVREESMRQSVLRRQVVSFSGNPYERSMSDLTFHHRPGVPASQVVLPEGTLQQVGAHVVGLAEHRERLRGQGQHLKRGILLYGPPGTGKTHTVRHLLSAATEATVVLFSGTQMAHVATAAQIARAHQPAIVVIEDCDLIAEDRDHHFGGGPSPSALHAPRRHGRAR